MGHGHYAQARTKYDSAEWTQALVTNYNVSAQTLFVNCANPTYVAIRTDATITVKFNSITNPSITIAANTVFELSDFQFQSLYVTTTGDSAIKIFFAQ